MRWIEGLKDDPPKFFSASSASGNLYEKLNQDLPGPEVRRLETGVGVDYAYKRYVREIMTFCHHLRTEQHIGFPRAHGIQRAYQPVAAVKCIPVHSHHTGIGEKSFYLLFHFFSPEPMRK